MASWSHPRGKAPRLRATERSHRYGNTQLHQVHRHGPAGPAPLRGHDLLLQPRSQPDPNTDYEAFSRFVTTDSYVLKHLFLSDLSIVFVIFGIFALGAYLPGAAPEAWGCGQWS